MVRRDKFSKKKRSLIMSKIRSKNTKLDKAMRKLLQDADIPFKMYPKILGNPDFLVGEKIVVFCDSSFWHGRNWERLRAKLARGSNPSYWLEHIARNRLRDRKVNRALRVQGYRVLRFWDYKIAKQPNECTKRIKSAAATVSDAYQ